MEALPGAGVPVVTFTETHSLAPPRALLTRRAVVWAADALADDDTTVNALARRLGVDWRLFGTEHGHEGGGAVRRVRVPLAARSIRRL